MSRRTSGSLFWAMAGDPASAIRVTATVVRRMVSSPAFRHGPSVAHLAARDQPAAIGDDQSRQRMSDLVVEVEAAVRGEFVGIAARCERQWHRDAEHAP